MATNADPFETDVIDLTHDGQGIADIDGRRVFVPGALSGERIRILPRRRRRQFQEAELLEVIKPAPSRVEPPCAYFGRCGGCALQHLSYDAQVAFKEKVAQDAFSRIAGLTPASWFQPMTGPEWHYRRRARLGVRYVAGKERVLVGFKERSTRYVTDMLDCRVIERPLDQLPGQLSEVIGSTSLRQRLPQAEVSVGENARAVVLRVLDEPNPADLEMFEKFGIENEIERSNRPG